MHVENVSVQLTQTNFNMNRASSGRGGAIYANSQLSGSVNVTVVLDSCSLSSNTAGNGGGAALYVGGTGQLTFLVNNSQLTGSSAGQIFLNASSLPSTGSSGIVTGSTTVLDSLWIVQGTVTVDVDIEPHHLELDLSPTVGMESRLTGQGNVTVTSQLIWNNGTIAGPMGSMLQLSNTSSSTIVGSGVVDTYTIGGSSGNGTNGTTIIVVNTATNHTLELRSLVNEGGNVTATSSVPLSTCLSLLNATIYNGIGGHFEIDENCTISNGSAIYGSSSNSLFINNGTLSPNGMVTIETPLEMGSMSTLVIRIYSATSSDELLIGETATLAGSIEPETASSPMNVSAGSVYVVLTAAKVEGAFTNEMTASFAYNMNYTGTEVELTTPGQY